LRGGNRSISKIWVQTIEKLSFRPLKNWITWSLCLNSFRGTHTSLRTNAWRCRSMTIKFFPKRSQFSIVIINRTSTLLKIVDLRFKLPNTNVISFTETLFQLFPNVRNVVNIHYTLCNWIRNRVHDPRMNEIIPSLWCRKIQIIICRRKNCSIYKLILVLAPKTSTHSTCPSLIVGRVQLRLDWHGMTSITGMNVVGWRKILCWILITHHSWLRKNKKGCGRTKKNSGINTKKKKKIDESSTRKENEEEKAWSSRIHGGNDA